MAGVTDQGFEIKRLAQVINDLEAAARNNFGDGVQTDVNAALGRALRIVASPLADLWETNEQVYNSFSAASATGIALDRLVSFVGIRRHDSKPSVAQALLTAEYDTNIPVNSSVSSSYTGKNFYVQSPVFFNLHQLSKIWIDAVNAIPGERYSVTYDSATISYTAVDGDSKETILQYFASQMARIPSFNSKYDIETGYLFVESVDVFRTFEFSLTANLVCRQATKVATIIAEEDGPLEQPAESIDTIAAPVSGWVSVINPEAASTGRDKETDIELRLRFEKSKETRASNTLEAIYSALIGVQDVGEVQVYENDTHETDERGLPPHSIAAIVQGGSSVEIAQEIWSNKPAGIQTYGNTKISIQDSQGFNRQIKFIRPVQVPIYINLQITALKDFASTGEDDIKDALASYADKYLKISDTVIYSRLYTPINEVPNHQIDSMSIGTDPDNLSSANISLGFDQIAEIAPNYITITIR